jgi:hypothetical protein
MKLPTLLSCWPLEWMELYFERVSIMIYDGGMSEEAAKEEAERDIRRVAENSGKQGRLAL